MSARAEGGEWPTVSVVVPMYNEERAIGACVGSLQRQDYPPDRLEIVVADGLSQDRSVEVVREIAARARHPVVTIISNPKRITAAGLNLGIAAASGEIIVRLDAHAEAPPDYVRSNVRVLSDSGADYVGGQPINEGEGYWGGAIALAMGSRFGVGAEFRHGSRARDVDTVAFGAFRRETFRKLGPFDEDLLYSEDNEYTDRLRAAGGRVHFDPAIRAPYRVRPSLEALFLQYRRYGWGRMRHALRDRRGLSTRHFVPMIFVGALGALGAASIGSSLARFSLAAMVALYLAAAVAAALPLALRSGWRFLPALPIVFGCLHIGYGIGQWQAIARRSA